MSDTVIVETRPPCDLCGRPAAIDGKTTTGPWAFMCSTCWRLHGVGKLGTGLGQRLIIKTLKNVMDAAARYEAGNARPGDAALIIEELESGNRTTSEALAALGLEPDALDDLERLALGTDPNTQEEDA